MILRILFFLLFTQSLFAAEKSFNLEDFRKLKQEIKKKTGRERIKDLVAALPKELRENYFVMLESKSIQNATCENPRVCHYTADAKFTMCYNGEASQTGFEAIEIQQFVDADFQIPDYPQAPASFVYLEEPFQDDVAERKTFLKKEMQKVTLTLSEKKSLQDEFEELDRRTNRKGYNPDLCNACHAGAPNWHSYASWPGALGENDGDQSDRDKNAKFSSFGDFVGQDRNPAKYIQCKEKLFKKNLKGTRYDGLNFSKLNLPNSLFAYTDHIFNLNFHRVKRLIETGPHPKLAKALLLAASLRCEFLNYSSQEYLKLSSLESIFKPIGIDPRPWFFYVSVAKDPIWITASFTRQELAFVLNENDEFGIKDLLEERQSLPPGRLKNLELKDPRACALLDKYIDKNYEGALTKKSSPESKATK